MPESKTIVTPAALPLRRIAFGSWRDPKVRPQPIWDAVVVARPELTPLLGDNIYADTLDMNVMRAKLDASQSSARADCSGCVLWAIPASICPDLRLRAPETGRGLCRDLDPHPAGRARCARLVALVN